MNEIIKFLNNDTKYNCSLSMSDNRNRITILFENSVPESLLSSGFELLNEHNFIVQGDYTAYKYIYKIDVDNNTAILTSDKDDKYTEPTITPTPITPTPITPTPELTEEEKAAIALEEFNSAKSSKIYEMSNACQKAIENGVDVEGKHYSYTLQDQSNMLNVMSMAKQSNMEVPYHADGESCSLYTYKQICTVYMAESINLTMQQTYFNQLKLYIQSLTDISDKETVDAIYYGIPLTGQYLEEYNNIIAQSNAIMTAITTVEE